MQTEILMSGKSIPIPEHFVLREGCKKIIGKSLTVGKHGGELYIAKPFYSKNE